jgi:Ca-activated chloride channel family protein
MKFAHTWLLLAAPFLALLLWLLLRWADRRRGRLLAKFAGDGSRTWAGPGFSKPARRLDRWLTLAAFVLLLVTLARPLMFRRDDKSELQGVPYLIALDASRSMLAMDVKPNRWTVATNALDRFLVNTKADRIGLITFSQVGFLNAPLTFDTLALRTTVQYLDPDQFIDLTGSALSSAMDRAGRYFVSNQVPQRLLILISDGEDFSGNPVELARRLKRQMDLKVCTIGVGTTTGGSVPMQRWGGGAAKNSFGQTVTSRLNESTLQRIAAATGGRYFRLGDKGEGLEQLRKEVLEPMSEAAAKEDMKNYRELYQLPLALALACLLGKVLLAADRRTTLQKPTALAARELKMVNAK